MNTNDRPLYITNSITGGRVFMEEQEKAVSSIVQAVCGKSLVHKQVLNNNYVKHLVYDVHGTAVVSVFVMPIY